MAGRVRSERYQAGPGPALCGAAAGAKLSTESRDASSVEECRLAGWRRRRRVAAATRAWAPPIAASLHGRSDIAGVSCSGPPVPPAAGLPTQSSPETITATCRANPLPHACCHSLIAFQVAVGPVRGSTAHDRARLASI